MLTLQSFGEQQGSRAYARSGWDCGAPGERRIPRDTWLASRCRLHLWKKIRPCEEQAVRPPERQEAVQVIDIGSADAG
jgi:hypothetical protein